MRLVNDLILRDAYDVIVIGAGLGGITAASLLAKRGVSVLLIDQQNKPGGACTSFKREDHVFDVGAAMLYGFGEKGFHPFRFLMNELEEPIDIVAHSTLARMTFEGQEIIFRPEIDRFIEELGSLFPDEREGLRAFYVDLFKLYENIVIKNEVVVAPSEFSPRQGLRRVLSDPLALVKMQRLLSTSTMDLLKRYFHTPEIFHFFDKLCSAYAYTTAEETPAVLAATMFIDNHIGGVYYPAGGAQMLPNTIEKAFERDGGQALYRQKVDEILIRNGIAYGVRLQNGVEIHAERVIANATVWNIYGRLVRPEHINPKRLRWAQSLIPTFPSITLYMVVDREAIPSDHYPWEIFIENRKVIDSSDLTLYINALVDETLCPPDQLVVMAIAPNFCSWPSGEDPNYTSNGYQPQKQREAERMLDQIEQHIPGFRGHIRTLIVGTPTTIERFLLKNGGAVGGPKNQIGQEMLNRLHARSEWKHLYFCGDSTVMGTGAPAAVVSGVGAANVILREQRLPDYDIRKYPKQFVHLMDRNNRRPVLNARDPITEQNAYLFAAQCQGCQAPACVGGCPAAVDIPGFLRRMEAKNYAGAARLIREKNPFGEVCGLVCPANQLCQKDCYRRDFAGLPVRIAELQRWVCAEVGEDGWLKCDSKGLGPKVAVVGGGPAAMSCAYYLAVAGCQVHIFAQEDDPVAGVWRNGSATMLKTAIQNDMRGLMSSGITFHGSQRFEESWDLTHWSNTYAAIFLDRATFGRFSESFSGWAVLDEGGETNQCASQVTRIPNIFVGEGLPKEEMAVVESTVIGRKAAFSICRFLGI